MYKLLRKNFYRLVKG